MKHEEIVNQMILDEKINDIIPR